MDDADLSSSRGKRVKADKKGRLAALERLKTLKGSKNKYEIVEEIPVYEEFDEKEFSRLVQERKDDDWIVDDDGCGYVEDGREIFDDDGETEVDEHTKKPSKTSKKKFQPPQKSNGKVSDIKNMFKMQTSKRKNEEVSLEDDDILKQVLADIRIESPHVSKETKPSVLYKKPKPQYNASEFTSPIRPMQHQQQQRKSFNPFAVKRSEEIEETTKSKVHLRKKVNFNILDDEEDVDMAYNPDSGDVLIPNKKKANQELLNDMDLSNLSQDMFEEQETDNNEVSESVSLLEDMETSMENEQIMDLGFVVPEFNVESNSTSKVNVDVKIDPGNLPLVDLPNGDKGLRFFWLDAYEDSYKQPGVVYLFGKVYVKECTSFTSCCVIVKDIPRKMFILPRETHMNMQTKGDTGKPVTMQDVYLEVNSVVEKMKILEFKSKSSVKNYAFSNPDIPDTCEYLEVQYSARYPPFSPEMNGATFSNVLGTDTSSLEIFLMEQKIKGPCWLDIQYPQTSNPHVSWCKVEAVVNKIQHVVPSSASMSIPPVSILSLHLVTVVNSRTQQNEIVSISCLSHDNVLLDKAIPQPHYNSHFCALTKPSDCIFPFDFKSVSKSSGIKMECLDSERALLAFFLAKLQKIDPDVIIGHDVVGFDLDVLLHRITAHKIPNWSRLGKLKRSGLPRFSSQSHGFAERNAACGRLICDIKISSKELLRCRSYDLVELASHILNRKYEEIPPENIRDHFMSSPKLLQLVNYSMNCSDLILRINNEINALPLALQITNIAGCVMSRTLLGGRSERNEFLLLHAFHEKNYIYPAKVQSKNHAQKLDGETTDEVNRSKGRRKPAYEGGLVLEPKKGFYDKYILLMDFNSLYPSIIQEYNICFTTLNRTETKAEEDIDSILPGSDVDVGILPTEIRKLVESRRQVKNMMKSSSLSKEQVMQYDIRQRALKLTANSMYGCLGFSHSRFYAKSLAALVTRKGREILLQTKTLVQKMGLDVIYGDTDSIMINTNQNEYEAVFQLGNRVKDEINKLYRLLEIDIDGVYKPMLLLKKKKYAAVSISRSADGHLLTKQEMKGLDIVRRDWSQLAKEAGEFVLKQILSDKSKEEVLESIHSYLMTLAENIRSEKMPITDFVILKQLTKHPEDYPDKKNLSHVLVALRINSKGGKKLKQNDTVPYIICTDGTTSPFTQRAYHPDELKTNSNLKIDVEYYLSNQVHPVVSRLCSPIEGTDSAMVATLLGLNPSKYAVVTKTEEQYDDKLLTASSVLDDDDRFNSCDSLFFQCPAESCLGELKVDSVFKSNVNPLSLQLSSCSKCSTFLGEYVASFQNQLQLIIRDYIKKYYKRYLLCEDSGCGFETRKMSLVFNTGGPICPACRSANLKLKYSEEDLYAQLAYFAFMFDLDKAKSRLPKDKEKFIADKDEEILYKLLKSTADKALKSSCYSKVNLASLFQGLFLPPATS